jgi:acyl transferase domain-containing protein
MSLIAPEYLEAISDIKTHKPDSDIKMASSVTGLPVDFTELDASYWVKNLVSPVLFTDAVRVMSRKSAKGRRHGRKADPAIDFLLEIGPHAALKGPLLQILKEEGLDDVGYASMHFRGQHDVASAVTAAGELASHGASIDISAVNNIQARARTLVNLPSYP